jgi:phosphate transport system substrate-binding protein
MGLKQQDGDFMQFLLWRMIQIIVFVGAVTVLIVTVMLNPVRCAPECKGANLAGSTLNDANLEGTNLLEARLSNAILERANLVAADLSGAIVTNANLLNADLSEAILVGTNFRGSDMRGVNLFDTDLRGTILTRVNLTRVDLRGAASLRGTLFNNANMIEAQLAGANLSGADLSGADLTSANLERADLSGAYLSGATLAGANLRGANLNGAWLNLVDLTGADLTEASLAGVVLIGGSLASANFSQADLSGVNAIGANFDGADLRGANFSGVRLLEGDLLDVDLSVDPLLASLNALQISTVVRNARLQGIRFDDTTVWSAESAETIEALLGLDLPEVATQETEAETSRLGFPLVDPADQRGDITITGSRSLYRVTRALADQFLEAGFRGEITLEETSSDDGLASFCQDDIVDIAMSSRIITEDEIADCTEIERTPIGLRVGTDAVVVAVNPNNDFIADATLEELRRIFSADSWSFINPRWPRRSIQRFVPPADTSSRDFFTSVTGIPEQALRTAENTVASNNPDELVTGISGASLGIGIMSFATFRENINVVQALRIDGIAINEQNVEGQRYPLSRPLYLYADAEALQRNDQVRTFLIYYLQNATPVMEERGFFPASTPLLGQSANTLRSALEPEEE